MIVSSSTTNGKRRKLTAASFVGICYGLAGNWLVSYGYTDGRQAGRFHAGPYSDVMLPFIILFFHAITNG